MERSGNLRVHLRLNLSRSQNLLHRHPSQRSQHERLHPSRLLPASRFAIRRQHAQQHRLHLQPHYRLCTSQTSHVCNRFPTRISVQFRLPLQLPHGLAWRYGSTSSIVSIVSIVFSLFCTHHDTPSPTLVAMFLAFCAARFVCCEYPRSQVREEMYYYAKSPVPRVKRCCDLTCYTMTCFCKLLEQ